MIRSIERALKLQAGELRVGAPLSAYLFLVMATYLVGRVVRDSLFLSRFKATQLPYADIATALTVGLLIAVYIRLGRHFSLRGLLLGSLLVFASNCLLFWARARFHPGNWLYPVIYIWDGMFGVLAPAQVWTLANHVLTTREARRIFGLLAGGAIAGGIFAGYFSKAVAKSFGTESLLLGMALFLFACLPLVIVIWRQHEVVAGDRESAEPSTEHGPRNLRESMALVFSSPYLRTVAALIGISSLVTEVIGWQFKAVAQSFIPAKDQLAAFFGDFTFYAGALALVVQLLLTTRFLRRFGIGVALCALPLGLIVTSAYMLIAGTLLSVMLLRGADWVWRYSIDKSTVELLYLPLPSRIKFQVKWFIDTVIWRLGTGVAGLIVLFFVTYLGLTARQMNWVVLVLLSGWLGFALVARGHYVTSLTESIREHRAAAEPPVLDRSTAEVLNANLADSDPEKVIYALNVLEAGQKSSQPTIRTLLQHPSPEVRKKAISVLDAGGDKTAAAEVEALLQDPSLEVRTEALLYLAHHHGHIDPLERIQNLGDFADFSIRSAMVAFLARPGEAQNLEFARRLLTDMAEEDGAQRQRTRTEAARLLGILPDKFDPLLAQLLGDPDPEVVRQAILSIWKLQKRRLVPELFDHLADPQYSAEAIDVLTRFGNSIVGRLRDQLGDLTVPIEVRRQLPVILANVGTQLACDVLVANLLHADSRLRLHILLDLRTMRHHHPRLECDSESLEMLLAAEVLGHYRSYQILGKLETMLPECEQLANAFSESMKREVERIFRVLDLLYPDDDFSSAYDALQSRNAIIRDNALEFLDNVLSTQFRKMLVPLLDAKVTLPERVAIANRLVHARIEDSEQAIALLIASNDPFLQSCGAEAAGIFGIKSLENELDLCMNHPDPLPREAARQAKSRLRSASSQN